MPTPPEDSPKPAPKTPYEGPFKRRALEKAEGEPRPHWLSATRFYFVGMIAALLVTGFYVSKLMITPDMVLRSASEDPKVPEAPRPILRAYCLGAAGATPVEPRPFCTQARPPSCAAGDTLQLTYATEGSAAKFVYAAVVGADLQASVLSEREAVRAAAKDAPLGQWKVTSKSARRHVAAVALFSREPLLRDEVEAFYAAWRTGVRLLERPPELTPALQQKGAELVAFLACVGRASEAPTDGGAAAP